MKEVKKSKFKKIILSNHKKIIKKFKSNFHKEIKEFTDKIFEAYKEYEKIDEQCKNNNNKLFVVAYLFNAINNLTSSLNLLFSGYLIPSGNLFRQFIESCAMAILASDTSFKNQIVQKKLLPHKSLGIVFDNRKKLNIDKEGWVGLTGLRNLYNDYSHASLFSIAILFLIDAKEKGIITMGPSFDKGKIKTYEIEIKRRINAIDTLINIINFQEKIK